MGQLLRTIFGNVGAYFIRTITFGRIDLPPDGYAASILPINTGVFVLCAVGAGIKELLAYFGLFN